MNLFQFLNRRTTSSGMANLAANRIHPRAPDYRRAPDYTGQLDEALEYLAVALGKSDDYIVRIVKVAGRAAACIFMDSVSDRKYIESMLEAIHQHHFPRAAQKSLAQYLIEQVLNQADAVFMSNMYEICEAVTTGNTVLMMEGVSPAIVVGSQGVEHRTPEQPYVEASSRGSQISFVETLNINVGLIRRSLSTDTLRVHKIRIGYRSHTQVAIIYMEDVANPVAVNTVLERLKAIHIDYISQSAAIEQRIIDHHWTMFPLMRVSQRVDSTCREINQGKICIVVDGDPTVLMAPCTFIDFFQTEEDYSHSPFDGTFIRLLRLVAFVFALFLPALYIAFTDFNPELLPKTLGLQIARSREGVPFPAVVEIIIMQIVIEILREATLRMPKQMGQTLGIVGGIVVGEAAVQAGLVSNILVIVISLTAISVFVTPSYEFSIVIRLAAWPMIIGATLFGLYGIMLVTIFYLFHIASLKSFGISYVDPMNGEHTSDLLTDTFLRLPVWAMDTRTAHLHPIDRVGDTDYVNPVTHPQMEKPGSGQSEQSNRGSRGRQSARRERKR